MVLRKQSVRIIDRFWIENLHGDSRKISEYAQNPRTSETGPFAFSTEFSPWDSAGSRNRSLGHDGKTRNQGAGSLLPGTSLLPPKQQRGGRSYWKVWRIIPSIPVTSLLDPQRENRYSFRPASVDGPYLTGPSLRNSVRTRPSTDCMEKRGGALIDIDREALDKRMRTYYDTEVDWDSLKAMGAMLTSDAARFDARNARSKLLAAETFDHGRIRRFAVRPFDHRWCYYSGVRPLWNEPRPSLWAQCWEGNTFLVSRVHPAKDPEGAPVSFVSVLSDDHYLAPDASCIPIRIKKSLPANRKGYDRALFGNETEKPSANLSASARKYLQAIGVENPDADAERASLLWMHALAIGYSPAYLKENEDGIRQDWPRIPLPASREVLEGSARLGHAVAALLDIDGPVKGVTSGTVRPELRVIGPVEKIGEGKDRSRCRGSRSHRRVGTSGERRHRDAGQREDHPAGLRAGGTGGDP